MNYVAWLSQEIRSGLIDTSVIIVLALLWLPIIGIVNAAFSFELGNHLMIILAVLLALPSSYPFYTGSYSIGLLGEFLFVFIVALFAWGLLGFAVIVASAMVGFGPPTSGGVVGGMMGVIHVGAGYLTAYIVCVRLNLQVFKERY